MQFPHRAGQAEECRSPPALGATARAVHGLAERECRDAPRNLLRLGLLRLRHRRLVRGSNLLPGQLLAGPGPSPQEVAVGHVPPDLSLPWFGSRNPLLRQFLLVMADAAAASASARRSPAPASAPRTPGRPGGCRSAGLTRESAGDDDALGVGVCVGVGPMGRPPPLGSGQWSWLTRVMRSTSPMFRCTIAPAHWMTGSCRRLAASLPQPRFQKVDHQMWRATRFYHCTYSPSTPRKTDARFWRYLLPLQRLEECAGLATAFRRISHRRASRSQTSSRDVSRSYGLPLGHSRREDLYSRSTLSRNALKLWD